MKPLVKSPKGDHVMRVNKMERACVTRFRFKIDSATHLHKIIMVCTLRLVTVLVSVNAGAGEGGLATGDHFLESEKSGNRDSLETEKKKIVVILRLLT